MKIFVTTVCFIFFLNDTFSQNLIPYRKKNKWGYADAVTKKILVPLIYEETFPFQFGRAIVKQKKKYGFIDGKGIEVIKPVYDTVTDFTPVGWAIVTLNGKATYINADGKETDAIYTDAARDIILFAEIISKDKKYGLINFDRGISDTIVPPMYDEISLDYTFQRVFAKNNSKWGMIDLHNNILIPIIYDQIFTYQNGLELVTRKEKLFGYVNRNLGITLDPKYLQMDFPKGNAIKVKTQKEKFGYLNLKGEEFFED